MTRRIGYFEQQAGYVVLGEVLNTCSPRARRPLPPLDWTLRAHGRLLGTVSSEWSQVLGRPIYEAWRDRWQLTPLPNDIRDDGIHLRAGGRLDGGIDVIISIRLATGEK